MMLLAIFAACVQSADDSATMRSETVEVDVYMYDPTPDCWSDAVYTGDSDYWWDVAYGDFSTDHGSYVPFVDGRCAFMQSDEAFEQVQDDPAVCPTQDCLNYCYGVSKTSPDCAG